MRTEQAWQGRVACYPVGVLIGPGEFHDGPDYLHVDKTAWYVWNLRGRTWGLHGPFKTRAEAEAFAVTVRAAPGRTYRIDGEVVSWQDFVDAGNEPDTLEAIALLTVGESTVLGMCDKIERLT